MIELHVSLEPTAGNKEKLEQLFRTRFVPAIKKRPGFVRVNLLKRSDAVREYQLCLSFETEALRLQWVACDDHQEVWPVLSGLCQRASWRGFDVIPQD